MCPRIGHRPLFPAPVRPLHEVLVMRALLLIAVLLLSCDTRRERPHALSRPGHRSALATAGAARQDDGPIRMEVLDPNAQPPVFVLRGSPRGSGRLVFLHGMCGHGLGYAQAFQYAAAKKGTLIAPQGDVSCDGPWARWSSDLKRLDDRIVETFHALGHPDPIDGIAIMGISQGATRAEALARKFPQRYTRLISMAAPTALKLGDLQHLRAAVLMVGELDRRDLMVAGERALKGTGVPVTFMLIPEATHGAMGPTPEQTMGAALEWLWNN